MEGKAKVLFIGDGVAPTGFARVIHSIIEGLSEDEFDIHHLAVNYTGDPHPFNHKIYPAMLMGVPSSPLGFEKMSKVINYVKPDLIFILNDIWVVDRYLKVIKTIYENRKLPKIVVYFPVDGEGYIQEWFKNFDIVDKTVVYTEFGKREVKQAHKSLDVEVIPHGVDLSTFYPLSDNKRAVREAIFSGKPNVGLEDFIVLNANRNQPRKRIDTSLRGFAMFAKDKPDAKYYHHAGLQDSGWDIIKLIKLYSNEFNYDLAERVIFSNLNLGPQSVEDTVLNTYYNVANVGINTSTGEGWGLCNVEQAVTGSAQLVPNHTACAELFQDCGLLMDASFVGKDAVTLLNRHYIKAETVADGLQTLYESPELVGDLSLKAFEKFTSPKYLWSNISKTWENLFVELLNG